MLGVSRWIISRRIKDYGLEDFRSFSKLPDDELDELVRAVIYVNMEQQVDKCI